MQPLIDADIFLYEIGAVGQYVDESGEIVYQSFEYVADILHGKVEEICKSVGATKPPKLFLTGNERYWGASNHIPNFREEVAKQKPYKGTRKEDKPFHYYNLYHYIVNHFDTTISNGCEADDLLGIEQYSRGSGDETIICTRDKDLRMVPGWHYGWECGRQPEFEPYYYSDLGEISLERKYNKQGKATVGKITGGGKAFFFAQLLTGDPVDNIGGLGGTGPVKAYELLHECRDERDYLNVIKQSYINKFGEEDWLGYFQEQADLLWIGREIDEEGRIKRYVMD